MSFFYFFLLAGFMAYMNMRSGADWLKVVTLFLMFACWGIALYVAIQSI